MDTACCQMGPPQTPRGTLQTPDSADSYIFWFGDKLICLFAHFAFPSHWNSPYWGFLPPCNKRQRIFALRAILKMHITLFLRLHIAPFYSRCKLKHKCQKKREQLNICKHNKGLTSATLLDWCKGSLVHHDMVPSCESKLQLQIKKGCLC